MDKLDSNYLSYKIQQFLYATSIKIKFIKSLCYYGYIIFKFLSKWHIFLGYIPSILLMFTVLYDIKLNCIFYSYYSLLLLFITSIYSRFQKFLFGLQIIGESEPLANYLYNGPYFKNITDVILERDLLEKKNKLTDIEKIHFQNLEDFKQKAAEIYDLTQFYIDYILNGLLDPEKKVLGGDILDNPNFISPIRRIILLFFVGLSIIYLIFFVNFLNNQYIFYIIYFILVIIIVYCWKKTGWTFNGFYGKKFLNIIFYILSLGISIFSLYIFFINNIYIYNMDIILKYPIIIIKEITYENKIIFLYNYFDHIIGSYITNIEEQNYVRFLLREINFEQYRFYICSSSITDIKIYIKIFIENYKFNKDFQNELIAHYSFVYSHKYYLQYFGILKIILMTGFIVTFINYYNNIYFLYKKISTLKGLAIIINDILVMSSKKYPYKNIDTIHVLKNVTLIIKNFIDKILAFFI